MSAKKKILAAASYVMVAALAVGGTVAYFTDKEDAVNVMTMGAGVDIELIEQQRDGEGGLEDFEQGKELLPIVGSAQGATNKDEYGLPVAGNYVDKIVTVKNTGTTDAYVRVLVAVPAALENANNASGPLHWNLGNRFMPDGDYNEDTNNTNAAFADIDYSAPTIVDEIDGVQYNIYTFMYKTAIAAGDSTDAAAFIGFYLDSAVDYDDESGKYTFNGATIDYALNEVVIPVQAQAVQAAGFASAEEAFTASGLPTNPWAATADAAVTKYTTAGTYYVNDNIIIDGTDADCVEAQGEGVVVNITGGRYSTAKADCAVWAKEGAVVNISGGYFSCGDEKLEGVSDNPYHSDLIYANNATINISGGFFTSEIENDWLLNLKDNTGASIVVTGGTFVNFNPSVNKTENPARNYVADGYKVVEETKSNGDIWYTVVAE